MDIVTDMTTIIIIRMYMRMGLSMHEIATNTGLTLYEVTCIIDAYDPTHRLTLRTKHGVHTK